MFSEQFIVYFPYILAALMTFLAVCIAYAAYRINELHKMYDHIPGPERKSFWTGNLNYITTADKEGKHFGDLLLDLVKKYGYTFKLILISKPLVVSVNQEAVKELLVTGGHKKSDDIYKRASKVFGKRCLGNGLVTETNNEKWSLKRNLMNPAFKREYLIELMGPFNECVDKLIVQLYKLAADKSPVCMMTQFSRTTLDVLSKVAFDKEVNSLENDDSQFPTAIRSIMDGMSIKKLSPYVQNSPTYWFYRRNVRKNVELIRETGKQWITERIQAINNDETVPNDILTHTVKMMGENTDLDFEEIIDDFCTFFIAGQDTISTATTFAVMFLVQNPDKMKKLVHDIDTVVGSKAKIDYNDLGKMNYLDMVWKETLRLYPPSISTVRETEKDFVIDGIYIPGGTDINLSTYISSRLPEFNDRPLEFLPERFEPDSPIKPSIYTYYPFTLGPRICLGQQFAKIEGKLILAKLFQNFEVRLEPGQSLHVVLQSTLKLKDGLKCFLVPRLKNKKNDK
ncbi:cholesterol 24-hydroxylase-like [Mytilus galloprovincialis]|uniref:cholesterol 24-hydroxylase-like n=1 Tax=Mytilus galloprovincialis TaxID=29158 RepID=UPI003F7CA6B0